MVEKINLSPLAGMAEWLPGEQLEFDRLKKIISDTYALYGFSMVETPILERAEVLLAKAGGETEKQIYRFNKGETDLAMRFDLTVPLARYVANYQNELTFPFRRQAVGKVYRGERAQKGRYREFYQADADIVGRGSLAIEYDGEIISLIAATMENLALGEFVIRINNRKIISGFMEAMKILDMGEVLGILDKAEKIGVKKLKEELGYLRLNAFEVRKIVDFAQIRGSLEQVVQALLRLDIENETFISGVSELETVGRTLAALGVRQENYIFDTAIIRGLDYYTGTIFETILTGAASMGSVCSGGRYENLVGNFAKVKMPGVGMSIGLTRFFYQLKELGLWQVREKTVSQVVILPLGEDNSWALQVAAGLRAAGVACEVYLAQASLKKKMKYADDLAVPYSIIIGEDELREKKMMLRRMSDGQQQLLSLEQVLAEILS